MSGERKGVCNEQFTPGPWKVDGDGIRALVRGSDLTIVATRHRLPGDIHQANAHLIAAAPDLYEALAEVMAAFREYTEAPTAHAIRRVRSAEHKADAALTKATAQPSPAHGESEGGGGVMDSRTNVTTPISALGGDAEFEVWQDGMPVAVACGPEADALQEALHYYAQYSQDGPVELFKVVRVKVVFGRAPATQEGNEG